MEFSMAVYKLCTLDDMHKITPHIEEVIEF
jgi:hypothetical protein